MAVRKQMYGPLHFEGNSPAEATAEEVFGHCVVMPNVGATLPAEAGAVSLVRDDAPSAADQAYSACRSGSA
jgi:hypothetical protein